MKHSKSSFPTKINDLYKLLGISKEATSAEITAAYNIHVSSCHANSTPIDNKIVNAFHTLIDPEKRKFYDRTFAAENLINREYDTTVTPLDAKNKLNEFFKLFFEKRGSCHVFKKMEVMQRTNNTPPDSDANSMIFRNFEGNPEQKFVDRTPYASWHFLQLEWDSKLKNYDKDSRIFSKEFFAALNDPLFSQAITVEWRECLNNEKDNKLVAMIDVHLNDAKKLDEAITQLKLENPTLLLKAEIDKRLAMDPKNAFASCANNIFQDVQHAIQKNMISTNLVNKIYSQVRQTLLSPTQKNVDAMTAIDDANKLGNANLYLIIGGSLTIFIGIAIAIAAFVATPMSLCGILLADFLFTISVPIIGTGCPRGLSKSLGNFIEAAAQKDVILRSTPFRDEGSPSIASNCKQ